MASPEESITLAHIVVEAAALTPDISHTPDIGKLAPLGVSIPGFQP